MDIGKERLIEETRNERERENMDKQINEKVRNPFSKRV
jgi:hypothetical protein